MRVFVWADGTWCEEEDLEGFLSFMSDDYKVLEIPDDCEDAEQYIADNA